jgi:chromosome partitioning protein
MMGNENIRIHRTVTGDVSNQFGASRLLPVIRNDIRLSESFAVGKPIRYYAPKSRAAEDFAQLGAFLSQLCR